MSASESQLASSAQTVVDSMRVQNEAVTASLTTLVDQQRQQNLEMLRLARADPHQIQVIMATLIIYSYFN